MTATSMYFRCVAAIALFFPCAHRSGAQEAGRIAGREYAERSQALIAYLAKAPPRSPDFPKDAMAYYVTRLQTQTDVPATLQAVEKMTDAAIDELRQDPFNLHGALASKTRLSADVTTYPPRVNFTKRPG